MGPLRNIENPLLCRPRHSAGAWPQTPPCTVGDESICMSSIGERLHLLRLDVGWSVAECAYRITIEANSHTSPEIWQCWERCSDEQASTNGLLQHLDALAALLAADEDWLRNGDNCVAEAAQGDAQSANVLPFNKPDQ